MGNCDAIPTLVARPASAGDATPSDGVTEGAAEKRGAARRQQARATAWVVALIVMGFPAVGWAMAPPVEFALEAVGHEAGDRSGEEWTMTKVGEGIVELCGEHVEGEDGNEWRFSGDGAEVRVKEDSEAPWGLLWGVLWSSEPADLFSDRLGDWGEETARIEVVDGAASYCYGEETRICMDEELRRVVALDLEIEGIRWGVRVGAEGERVMLSGQGSLVARLRAGQGCRGE